MVRICLAAFPPGLPRLANRAGDPWPPLAFQAVCLVFAITLSEATTI